jgi:hypothetical protein
MTIMTYTTMRHHMFALSAKLVAEDLGRGSAAIVERLDRTSYWNGGPITAGLREVEIAEKRNADRADLAKLESRRERRAVEARYTWQDLGHITQTESFATLSQDRNGWTSRYDESRDEFHVRGPEGTFRLYRRVRG